MESSLLKTERGRIRPPNLHPLLPPEKEKEKVTVEVPAPKPEEKEKKEVEKKEEKKPAEKKIAEKKIPVAPPPEKKIKKVDHNILFENKDIFVCCVSLFLKLFYRIYYTFFLIKKF